MKRRICTMMPYNCGNNLLGLPKKKIACSVGILLWPVLCFSLFFFSNKKKVMGNDIFFEMHDGTFDISFLILFLFSFICVNVLLNCLLFQFKRKDFEHYTGINILEPILKFRKIFKVF